MHVGSRLKKLRLDHHMSVMEMANAFDLTRQYIYMIERSEKAPSSRILDRYSEFFDVTIDDLLGKQHRNVIIPIYSMVDPNRNSVGNLSLPETFLEESKSYFAIVEKPEHGGRLVVFERDNQLNTKKLGVFLYKNSFYFSRLERYADGSLWLISDQYGNRPQPVTRMEDLTILGYSFCHIERTGGIRTVLAR